MDKVKGHYPPKKIERIMKANELKRQHEAEAAAREYIIDTSEARGSAMQLKSSSKPVEKRKSDEAEDEMKLSTAEKEVKHGVADKPRASDSSPGPAMHSAPQVPTPVILQDSIVQNEISATPEVIGPAETEPVVGGVPIFTLTEASPPSEDTNAPVLMLPDVQNAKTGGDVTIYIGNLGKVDAVMHEAYGSLSPVQDSTVAERDDVTAGIADEVSAAGAVSTMDGRNVGQSQNNAAGMLTPKTSTGTQTSPRDETDTGSTDGSFDDSVKSL